MPARQTTLTRRQFQDGKRPTRFRSTLTNTQAGSVTVAPTMKVLDLTVDLTANGDVVLSDGVEGQEITVNCVATAESGSGDALLKPTNRLGYASIAFDAAGESANLRFTGGKWTIKSVYGATVA